MTFEQLCELEPKLKALAEEAKATRDDGSGEAFCANAVWYGYAGHRGIKRRLLLLVGFERPDGPDELLTTEAYDVSYQAIYDMLPDCRGECGCMRI